MGNQGPRQVYMLNMLCDELCLTNLDIVGVESQCQTVFVNQKRAYIQ